jgi:D-beta-D-heptose 7-phosphate kinase/D-beta-D-heptose 1-phosphate adenosyltransferase
VRLKLSRARTLLKAMRLRRVLVVGDVMLDAFLWGKVARISPEAPVPVVEIQRETFHAGGAANVAANVRSLGGSVTLAGVVGQDAAGTRLRDELQAAGIDASLVASNSGRPTTLKTRILAHHQQVVRADREEASEIPRGLEADLLRRIANDLAGAAALVVSDYHKGVVTRTVMRTLAAAARASTLPLLVDPKVPHFDLYRGVSLVTPNQLEAEAATGIRIRSQADVEAAGVRILSRLGCGAALITRGEHGMSLFERGARPAHLPAAAREVFDVTGAGDTVIATLALAVAAGATLCEAAALANLAAGVVVAKLGTATASPEEILSALDTKR